MGNNADSVNGGSTCSGCGSASSSDNRYACGTVNAAGHNPQVNANNDGNHAFNGHHSANQLCENSYMGRCGNGNNCWEWVCGSCNAYAGCWAHDMHCSCF